MGHVHQLITTHGVDAAKASTTDKLDRQCIDTAFAVMTNETQRVGIMHAGFAMTALPHKEISETQWMRQGAGRYSFWINCPHDLAVFTDRGCQNTEP